MIQKQFVTVIGGTGFVGKYIVKELAASGLRVKIAVRRPDLCGELTCAGAVGQIIPVQANVRYPESLRQAVRGASAVINLAGVLNNRGKQTFDAINHEGSANVARATKDEAIDKLIHFSCIGADRNSKSDYLASKGKAEDSVRDIIPGAKILRPSVIFGSEDQFFNLFADLSRNFPALPLFGNPDLQPVYVGDVAKAAKLLVLDPDGYENSPYELGGPGVMSLRDIYSYIFALTDHRRLIVRVPTTIGRAIAFVLEFLPKPPITRDQIVMLQQDNVVAERAVNENRTLKAFDIEPQSLENEVPRYLFRYRRGGQFNQTTISDPNP